MNPKKKNMEVQKMMCISFLLVECLDNLKVTEPKIVKYRDDLIGFIEELSATVSDTTAIQKSTYFSDLTNKIDTLIRRSFEDV
jgi:hypothetical protein